jgi:hypothetical protein
LSAGELEMVASIYADSLTITTYILSLLWGVVSVAIVLANRRRRRLPFYYSAVLGVRPRKAQTKPGAHAETHTLGTSASHPKPVATIAKPVHQAIPADWRLPVQSATPDQVVIHIEPDGNPTAEQRNIQRIIRHLQTMPKKTATQ